MDVFSEFIEPSRVSQCIGCNFISPEKKHLVIGKATLLQIFEVVNISSRADRPDYKLKLVEQYKLHGLITDIKAVRTVESPELDYLMISTKYAKFSIIRWDHHLNSISTVSLHYYENSIQEASHDSLVKTDLIVDPNSFCSCLRFKNMLTILPFEVLDDEGEDEDGNPMDDVEKEKNGDKQDSSEDIYDSSFMIDARSLDSSIGEIIDVQFLQNYKKPTLAILSSKSHTWAGTLPKRKDNVMFHTLSLDLQSKSSTTMLKFENFPYDVDRIVPLSAPLMGSLLLGCNEIIHIDNGGMIRRVALNEYTSTITASTKNYLDQTALNLKLEESSVVQVPNDNRVLLVLRDGSFYGITFQIDGKIIKSVEVETIDESIYESIVLSYPGEMTTLDNNLIFFGNKNGNSPLVEFYYEQTEDEKISKEKEIEVAQESDDDVEDLYDEEENGENVSGSRGPIRFIKHDELINNGPVSNFTLGHYSTEKFKSNLVNPNYNEVSIISNCGTDRSGCLNLFSQSIQPSIKSSLSFSQINRMWTVCENYLVTSDDINLKSEIFQMNKSFARLNAKHFVNDQLTVAMHELNNGKFVLQVTPKQINVFSNKFKRRFSLTKEIQNDEIIHSTCNDEFLMIFMASGEVMIFSINTYNGTYSRIEIPEILSDTIITTGYITNSFLLNSPTKSAESTGTKGTKRKLNAQSSSAIPTTTIKDLGPKSKIFVLATGDNRIVVFDRFHNQKCYQLNNVDRYTDHLFLGEFDPRDTIPDPFIKQIIFNSLGDKYFKEEYLIILTIGGEILLYKLFFDGESFVFAKEKNLFITGAPENAYPLGTTIERRLVYFADVSGFTGIFITGITPYFITKTSHSIPRIFKFTKIPAISFAPYSDGKIQNGLIFLDNKKNARICELSAEFNYDNNWPVKKIHIGETVKSVTYHELSDTYIVSSFKEIPFNCLDEEGNPIVGVIKDKEQARSYKGSIKLVSPINWTVIDSFDLDDNEIGLNVKSMPLDVGSSTKKFKTRKELVVVGCGKYRMEDLGAYGSFKILEIIDIIPEPGKPETNHKFKTLHQEEIRSAVTSICDVSGRLLVAQGQKIIIRDLQDDGVVPVAFLDTSVYISEAKSFGNIILLGDSLKSVWLAGFDAEPFRMIMLGKDLQSLDVNCADFLTKDQEIYILVADGSNVLHLLQYDPDNPLSNNGQRLISRASFNVNSSTTCLKSIPKNEEYNPMVVDNFQNIGSTIDGSFFTVFPVNETTYRRMYILQQQLNDKEYHSCGLNPRLNRFGGLSLTVNDTNIKPILDYELIKSFAKLNEDRKKHLASKISMKNSSHDIWKDLIEFENVLKAL